MIFWVIVGHQRWAVLLKAARSYTMTAASNRKLPTNLVAIRRR